MKSQLMAVIYESASRKMCTQNNTNLVLLTTIYQLLLPLSQKNFF